MTLLIVDDLQVVVSGIYFGIDWNALGIHHVYTATSAFEAKHIFMQYSVDLMLCDIDMPNEDGLSLFQWVKSNGYHTECIFLTSHDNFIYVKKAFHLGGFDYILQPARYEEITNTIAKAITHMHAQEQKNEYESYGKIFFSEIDSVKAQLVNNWYNHAIDYSVFIEKLSKYNINLPHAQAGYIIAATFSEQQTEDNVLNTYIKKFFLSSLHLENCDLQSFKLNCSQYLYLIFSSQNRIADLSKFKNCLDILFHNMSSIFNDSLAFYASRFNSQISDPSIPISADAALKNIKKEIANNVSLQKGVFISEKHEDINAGKISPCINTVRLSELLKNKEFNEFNAACKTFLHVLQEKNMLTKSTLNIFHLSLLQLFYQSINVYDTSAAENQLVEQNLSLINRTPKNIQEADQLVDGMVALLTCLLTDSIPEEKTYVNQIIQYIHTHLNEPLKRSEIAASVYLTPDYVTKIFKEEMGISLKDYILQEKINLAKDWLHTTDLPIEEIAGRCGFTNFSYFSQVYKKIRGVSPKQERKNR